MLNGKPIQQGVECRELMERCCFVSPTPCYVGFPCYDSYTEIFEGKKMKARDLTFDEWWTYMPKWKKCFIYIFVVMLPFVGSISDITF